MTEVLVLRGTLEGHNGWVTRLVTTPSNPDLLLSASRDKTLITWQLTRDEQSYGYPKRALKGHSHIVSDAVISPDGAFAISSSWDKTLRLWKLETGESVSRFVGHEGDVLSVSISSNSRHIVSGSRDKTIKVWNTVGDCVHTLKSHNDWVSTVKFFPTSESTNFLSVGWDKVVKVCFSPSNYSKGLAQRFDFLQRFRF
ncbi:unnamed protein product [Kuraishia capsulata CBS 1993]|uniref:Uncharacterized protein n=1 Tax=Kuraishia capsulata CBS 1993 TaxID=1382522 RepID=W6MUW5_9ASCO|nr:uncharacterized protein KUCA_T00005585001 [Kuraishia capsulata CBS 1993]CDK29592.1 unnamed protein product [Kuraishia capsulata CBS 1993]